MTAHLLDLNVLIALAWPEHSAHHAAERWFSRNADRGWATCPLVQAGFVRILSNPSFSPRAVSPQEAIAALRVSLEHPAHQFWADSIPVTNGLTYLEDRLVGHQQITDAYLLALALHRKGKLATLDRSLVELLPAGSAARASVVVIG